MKKMLYMSLVVVLLFATLINFTPANAASLTVLSNTLTRLKASTAANHDIRFRVATAVETADDEIVINFDDSGFNISSVVHGDITLRYGSDSAQVYGSCSSDCHTATVAASAAEDVWGLGVSGQDLTLSGPSTITSDPMISANDYVRVQIANEKVVNPTADEYLITITTQPDGGATTYDTGQIAIYIVTDDQVAVTGTVDPSISFTLSTNNTGFGNMNSSAVRYATPDENGSDSATPAFSITSINTNAANGLSISTQSNNSDSTAGLYSSSVTETIAAATIASISAGTAGFAFCATNESSNLSVESGFACETGTTAISTSAQPFATASGPIATQSIDVRLKAAVSGTTKAATDYATTLTIIVTGNF